MSIDFVDQQRDGTIGDIRWFIDIIVLSDIGRFLDGIVRLTAGMEAYVCRLARTIADQGGPTSPHGAMRTWVIQLIAQQFNSDQNDIKEIDIYEVVKDALYELQADLETCLDPVIGGGDLSRSAAGLFRAIVESTAYVTQGDGLTPYTLKCVQIKNGDLDQLGVPLLGVSIAGHKPFRLVRGTISAQHPLADLPDLRRLFNRANTEMSSVSGVVVIPHLDTFDEAM